jgi:hypothetical protein
VSWETTSIGATPVIFLSSATSSLTAIFPPRIKVCENLILAQPALANLPSGLSAQNPKHLVLQLDAQRAVSRLDAARMARGQLSGIKAP